MPNNVTTYNKTTWQNLPNKTSAVDATNLNNIEQGIKNLNDWVNTLNVEAGKIMGSAAFTTALLTKLNGIEAQANKYILPTATAQALGGVKIDGVTITIDANGVISSQTSGVDELANLTDVNISQIQDGQILKWDSTSSKWVNTSEAEVRTQLSLLEDVDIDDTTLADGQVLKYNGTSEKWENGEGGDVLGYDETLDVLGLPPNPVYRLRALIPAMTSATTPSGVVSAGSNHANFPCWKAVNQGGTDNDRWLTIAGVTTSYWQYKFDTGKRIDRFEIRFGALPQNEHNFFDAGIKIQASNDGTTFTDLFDFTLLASDNNIKQTYDVDDPDEYMYYRILFSGKNASAKASGNQYDAIISVQMYERYLA